MTEDTIVKLMTKKQLSEYLVVHPRTITRLVTAGDIPAIKVGKTAVRFNLAEVLAALERLER